MRLDWLPDVIRGAGLDIHVEAGWDTRGRPLDRPITAVICHHTATPATAAGDYPSLRIVRDGRSDLPGPLSQLGLGRSGRVYVIASGRANHAGPGAWPGVAGNADTIGIEAEHPGDRTPWPQAQYDAYARLCRAVIDHLGLPAGRVIGHKEWAPSRKIDPTFDMDEFRQRIEETQMDPELEQFIRWLKREYESAGNPAFVASMARARDAGMYTQHTKAEDAVTASKLAVFLDRVGLLRIGDRVGRAEQRISALERAESSAGTVDVQAREDLARLRNHLRDA